MSNPSVQSLDTLLLKVWPLLRKAETMLSNTSVIVEDLRQLLNGARLLNKEYSTWPEKQPEEWRPRTTGYLTPSQERSTWSTGRVDTYVDREYPLAC